MNTAFASWVPGIFMGIEEIAGTLSPLRHTPDPNGEAPRVMTPRTREVAQAAIEILNDHGASQVSINELARMLGMSPGNLRYHFRTTKDLFWTLFDILNDNLRNTLPKQNQDSSLSEITVHQIEIQACLWEHRYFWRDLDFIIHVDERIFPEYLKLQEFAISQQIEAQKHYKNTAVMLPTNPWQTEREIAQNCWMMWIGWVRWEAILAARQSEPINLNEVLHRLTRNSTALHISAIKEEFRDELYQLLDALLL